MTRKEAIKRMKIIMDKEGLSKNNIAPNLLSELIDEIYDDFENKICKNCKFHKSGYCYQPDICYWIGSSSKEGVYVDYLYLKNFGCNRFERIEK